MEQLLEVGKVNASALFLSQVSILFPKLISDVLDPAFSYFGNDIASVELVHLAYLGRHFFGL